MLSLILTLSRFPLYCNSNAFDIPSLDSECLVEEDISKACLDYGDKLDELSQLLEQAKPQFSKLRSLARDMARIKLQPVQQAPASDSPELRQALSQATRITKEQGATSADAKIAWETVEEIASAGLQNSLGGRLMDDECLVETALDACLALEELNRVVKGSQEQQ